MLITIPQQSYPRTQQQVQHKAERKRHQQQCVWVSVYLKGGRDTKQTETGQSQHLIISRNKIFKNSLYKGLSSFIYTLIYGKETQKYICINPYICHIYISINHFKSLFGKKTKKRDREQKEERSNSSSIPAARQVNTIQIRFTKHFQHVQIWLVFNTNNSPTHPLNTLQNA